jgi:hypothetical protein
VHCHEIITSADTIDTSELKQPNKLEKPDQLKQPARPQQHKPKNQILMFLLKAFKSTSLNLFLFGLLFIVVFSQVLYHLIEVNFNYFKRVFPTK